MTPEEAIKSMRNLNMVLSITDSERESVNMAIEALEKQIPKNVYNVRSLDGELLGFCPVCNEALSSLTCYSYVTHYCKCCGQRLKW